MSWFTDHISNRGKSRGGTAVLDRETDSADVESGPALIMLVADANGVASYRLHTYRDTEPAKAFLNYWFPKDANTGVIAFWALTAEPDAAPETAVEPMVLVRDAAKRGVIYPFSFVDMDSAQAFARQEVEKGLGLESVLIYWAVTVGFETDQWGTLQMSPASPPACLAPREADVLEDVISAPVQSEPATTPTKASGIERSAFTVFSAHFETMQIADPAKEVRMKKPAPRVLEDKLEFDKAIPEEFGGSVISNGCRTREDPAVDLEKEILKVLQVRRWETREEPFRGIDSPPGRF